MKAPTHLKSPIAMLLALTLLHFSVVAGTWDSSSFGNDAALDWVENELKPDGLRAVERAVDAIVKAKGYIDADASCAAIAACEVIAASQGRPAPDLPAEVATIAITFSPTRTEPLRNDARKALDHILADSELRELWKEADNLGKWEKAVRQLQSRL